jgi:hypothetical protein
MSTRISGKFDVKMIPQAPDEGDLTGVPGRMVLDKRYHGDLDATSRGQMLAAQTTVKGSAGYVAIEQVTGTLQGRSGSFMLQHTGIMNRGVGSLSITVIPDSGTGELADISGTMSIEIAGGVHTYIFEFTLTAAAASA